MAGGQGKDMEAPERIDYRKGLEWLERFVEIELGNGHEPRPRPDIEEWKIKRVKTIQALEMLREKLDAVCVGANYGKAGGYVTEIVGAGAAIIGVILCFVGVHSGQRIMNVGILSYHIGALIGGISNVIENSSSAKYLNNIESILKEDQKVSLQLTEWLTASSKLDTHVQAIFGVSLTSEKYGTVMKVLYEFSKLFSSVRGFDETVHLMKKGRYSVYIGNDVKIDRLQKFSRQLSEFPQLTDKIRTILFNLSELTTLVQYFINGAQAYHRIMGISSSVAPTRQAGLNSDIPTAREVSIFCISHSISMAVSIISLVKTKNIIQLGKSQNSDAVNQLISLLERELKKMEDLEQMPYCSFCNCFIENNSVVEANK